MMIVHGEGIKQDVGMVSYVEHCAPECVNHHVALLQKKSEDGYKLEVLNPQFDQSIPLPFSC